MTEGKESERDLTLKSVHPQTPNGESAQQTHNSLQKVRLTDMEPLPYLLNPGFTEFAQGDFLSNSTVCTGGMRVTPTEGCDK